MEDKKNICSLLTEVLRKTRAGSDLESIDYMVCRSGDEIVTLYFFDADPIDVDVTADSGLAMIEDIIRKLK